MHRKPNTGTPHLLHAHRQLQELLVTPTTGTWLRPCYGGHRLVTDKITSQRIILLAFYPTPVPCVGPFPPCCVHTSRDEGSLHSPPLRRFPHLYSVHSVPRTLIPEGGLLLPRAFSWLHTPHSSGIRLPTPTGSFLDTYSCLWLSLWIPSAWN